MTQKSIGAWITRFGQFLLVGVAVTCLFDVTGLSSRGEWLVSFWGYMFMIFSGVAMQFVGAAVPNMNFSGRKPKAKTIDKNVQAISDH